jgi:hypothetical protein
MSGYWMLLFTLTAVLIVLAIIAISVGASRRRKDVWEHFARRHQFVYDQTPDGRFSVRGVLDSRPLELKLSKASSDTGVLGVEEVRMAAEVRGPLPPGLELARADGLIGEVSHKLDPDHISTGDEQFDRTVIVKGDHPPAVIGYLTEPRRRALERLCGSVPGAIAGLADRQVFIQDREMISEPEHLERRMRTLLDVARVLDHEDHRV